MTTCREVLEIARNPDKENMKVELKRSTLLREDKGQKKLAYAIVALANRFGGKLILGLDDDGSFEGKNIFNVDEDKGIIENICHMKISPVIDYDTEFVRCEEGDVLIVNVQKRKGIPHAFIVSRKGPEIKNRIYYIRTSHGKRLVSDRQLQWLFTHQEDPDFEASFRIVVNYVKDNLQIPVEIEQPISIYDYAVFVDALPPEHLNRLTHDWARAQSFFVEITPFVFLSSLSRLFKSSWMIMIHRHQGMIAAVPMRKKVDYERLSLVDLPEPPKDSLVSRLSWDFRHILERFVLPDFCVPMGTKVEITYSDEELKSQLSIINPAFRFDFIFNCSSIGAGLHFSHPLLSAVSNARPEQERKKISRVYQYTEIDCRFDASFRFPEEDVDLFNEYYHYAKSIKNHLKYDWDYDIFLEKLPHNKLYTIDAKLSKLMEKVDKICEKEEKLPPDDNGETNEGPDV